MRERAPIFDRSNQRELKPDGIRGGCEPYPGKPYCFDSGSHGGCVHPDAQRTLGYPVRRDLASENRAANGDPVAGRKQRVADPWVVLRTQGR